MSTEDYEAFESMLSERLSVIEVDCREARAEGRRALEIKDTVGMQLAKQTLQMKTLERRRVAAMLSVRGTAVWNPGWDSGSARGGCSISATPIPPPTLIPLQPPSTLTPDSSQTEHTPAKERPRALKLHKVVRGPHEKVGEEDGQPFGKGSHSRNSSDGKDNLGHARHQ